MKFHILLVLLALASGSPTEKTKGRRASLFNLPANTKLKSEDLEQLLRLQSDYDDIDIELEPATGELRQANPAEIASLPSDATKGDSSSGRFLKKLLLFGGGFGGGNTQPIIPIIITGAGNNGNNGGGATATSTGTISGTGTITTTPTGRADEAEGGDLIIDEEDVLEDQIISGKNTPNKQQLGGGNSQQNLGFVVPQKYLHYFQNNPNAVALNPGVYNTGANRFRRFRINNGNNANVKRKRAKNPTRRRLVAVN